MIRWVRWCFGLGLLVVVATLVAACGDERDDRLISGSCRPITTKPDFRYSATANSGWFTAAWGTGIEEDLGDGWQGLSIRLPASPPLAASTLATSGVAAHEGLGRTMMCH